jgi:hypothetical protein
MLKIINKVYSVIHLIYCKKQYFEILFTFIINFLTLFEL